MAKASLTEIIAELDAEFNGTSDRGCSISAGAILDDQLGELLAARLADEDRGGPDKLLEQPGGGLKTFNSRIEACYRHGLISSRLRDDLHSIREIRNDFAHKWRERKSFDDQSPRDRINNLWNSLLIVAQVESLRNAIKETRVKFFVVLANFIQHLDMAIETVRRIEPHAVEAIYAAQWKGRDFPPVDTAEIVQFVQKHTEAEPQQ